MSELKGIDRIAFIKVKDINWDQVDSSQLDMIRYFADPMGASRE